jgi:hypothetical protein
MIQEKVYKGRWYIPETSESLSGTLYFDPVNGPKLEVIGTFNNSYFDHSSSRIVLGDTTDGAITLVDCDFSHRQASNETGAVVSGYIPRFIFDGCHFRSFEELHFTSVEFSLFNLLEWLNVDGLLDDGLVKQYSFEYKKPEDICFKYFDECEGEIKFNLSAKNLGSNYHIQYDQTCGVILKYSHNKGFQEILNDIFNFVGFVTLATYGQSYPIEIKYFRDDIIEQNYLKHLKKEVSKPILCYYLNSFYSNSYKITKWPQHVVRFRDISDDFQNIIYKWYSKSKELEPVIKMMLSAFVNKYEFTIEKFMDTVRALETFHRHNHSNEVIPKEKYAEKLDSIVSSFDKDEKKWLRDKLQFANEPTLKERLRDMVSIYAFPYFTEKVPDTELLCKQAKNSRNYYTHFAPKLKDKALDGRQLFELTEKLKLILFSAVFRSIGIDSSKFEEGAKRQIYW